MMTVSRNILNKLFNGILNRISTTRSWHNTIFDINPEVKEAIAAKKPLVALESTIITHGMRYPHNFETALKVENIVRSQGATPVTIAILKGKIKIGLHNNDLHLLSSKQNECFKISRRDIPFMISQKLSGGTTVSSTMLIAHKFGISLFVTGGIGGVHRDYKQTMDLSADLTELGRTSVAVISSGVKSILDIGRTLEYLETQGVAVATFGPNPNFPAFYTSKSKFMAPYCLKSVEEAAEFILAINDFQLNSGALIAVPVPEEFSFPENEIEIAINRGIEDCKKKNVSGKDVTPFLLKRISQITGEKSLASNVALIKNNALIGAKISVELSNIREKRKNINIIGMDFPCLKHNEISDLVNCNVGLENGTRNYISRESAKTVGISSQVVVVGGSNLDCIIRVQVSEFKPKAVFFSCMDSRMIPTRFTETDVGDMFVVRNAGNLIPHSRNYPDEITTTEPAALELGCVINNVRHIIVCGHSDCKAMNLLYSLQDETHSNVEKRRISPLKAWMCAHASTSLEKFKILHREGFERPLLFEGETPQRQFVAYIDPENKFAFEDKLSQADGRMLPGREFKTGGGVGRNMADALGKLGMNPYLITAVGNDDAGDHIINNTISHLNRDGTFILDNLPSAICYVICDQSGECRLLIGNMDIHQQITIDRLKKHEKVILESSLVVMDGNLPKTSMKYLLELCNANDIPIWYEPTDVAEASKIFFLDNANCSPDFISPNYQELQEIIKIIRPSLVSNVNLDDSDNWLEICIEQGRSLAEDIGNVIITLGHKGVLICRRDNQNSSFFAVNSTGNASYCKSNGPIIHMYYQPAKVLHKEVISSSGAGDCFASGFIAAMLKGESEESCVKFGFKCSLASLTSSATIPEIFPLLDHSI